MKRANMLRVIRFNAFLGKVYNHFANQQDLQIEEELYSIVFWSCAGHLINNSNFKVHLGEHQDVLRSIKWIGKNFYLLA